MTTGFTLLTCKDQLQAEAVESWLKQKQGEEYVRSILRKAKQIEEPYVQAANEKRTERLAALEERRIQAEQEEEEDVHTT